MPTVTARLAALSVVASAPFWGAVPATAETDPPAAATAVHGNWINSEPLKILSSETKGAVTEVTFSGRTTLTGDLSGRTTFTGRGTINSRTGIITGQIKETFFGSVAHLGRGTIHFSERFRQNATTGALTIDARTVSGTQALEDVRGPVTFVGFTDAQEVGNGTYTGHLRGEEVGEE